VIAAKENGLELEMVEESPFNEGGVSAEYKKINKLGKIPTFVGADGFVLTECIAIAIYSTFIFLLRDALPLMHDFNDEHIFYYTVIPVRIPMLIYNL